MDIADAWKRIEAAATAAGKSLYLRPGASEADIAAAEQVIGRPFPPDFRASLALHDGSDGAEHDTDGTLFPWMVGCSPLRSLADLCAQYNDLRDWYQEPEAAYDADPRIMNAMHHAARIPIAGNRWWDGDNTYLDFVPGEGGTEGQVITFSSECDMEWLGATFGEALGHYVRALETGAFVWFDGDVVPADTDEHANRAWQFAKWIAKTAP